MLSTKREPSALCVPKLPLRQSTPGRIDLSAVLLVDVLWAPRTPALLSPIAAVVPLQLFAYGIARAKGLNVNQPRNLAKTVTVE